ncbi:hypothetical protein [uncultured Chitinophaga sp.]|jgi:hypothetical protein|uniref:hypothetical protein n=1 Tax=uncultured Chitinophaga sp. TaxID=339340 RepID=UPI002601EA88|nr:hypothetical protein [uncultured Chitinophaga sp.]
MQTTVSNRRGGLLLLLTGVLAIALIIIVNRSWFSRIAGYWRAFPSQAAQPDLEARKVSRYGNAYILSRSIALSLERAGKKETALVLVPPTSYFKAKGLNYHVPEPAVFYYYTSLKTVRPDTKDTANINYVVSVENKDIAIRKVKDKQQLSKILAEYRKYRITL